MPDDAPIEDQLKAMIVERLFLKVAPDEIADDDLLMEKFEIDSVRLFEIVIGLEEVFDISLEDDEFSIERFESVKAIAALVRDKLPHGGVVPKSSPGDQPRSESRL
ncbi:MAG: acyl carrier protein [Planctomycetes bacterium]|nr:acyl carrier protein [Planctomycetota bacterium]